MRISMKTILAGVSALLFALPALADDKVVLPAPSPTVRIVPGPGESAATPMRTGCVGFTHNGGGNIYVTQPAPNVLVVTMTGASLAKGQFCKESVAGWTFRLLQNFDIVCAPPVKSVKLSMEARLQGVLRSRHTCCEKSEATAHAGNIHAAVTCCDAQVLAIDLPPQSVAEGDSHVVLLREGPIVCPSVAPGTYTLHQNFDISAAVRKAPFLCKTVSADFAPDQPLDPKWLGLFDPFQGTVTKEFGYKVTIKAVPE